MTGRKKSLFNLMLAFLFSICGCGKPSATAPEADSDPTLVEEISVSGFDPEGEPTIKKWSDGAMWIHFEAMPPFFAEDKGTEAAFETFETQIQDAIGLPVVREDREVFVIPNPQPETAAKAKAWLESYHSAGS